MKIKLGVFFGGRSVEHEVSIISAIQAINNFDRQKYDIVPVYISKDNAFYSGEYIDKIEEYRDLKALLKKSVRVIPISADGRCELIRYPMRRFGSPLYDFFDVAFPVVHGTNVEDGALQGFFRTLGVPFAGCDVLASAAGMDKFVMKTLFREAGLPALDCHRFDAKEYLKAPDAVLSTLEQKLRYPIIIKPINLGSSVGIKLARDSEGLKNAIDYAQTFSSVVLAENAVENLREINCAVLGDYEGAKASECEEPLNTDEILSYEDKYISGGKNGSKGMSGLKRLLPAPISEELREKIRQLAIRAFQALDCNGVARVDFLMDNVSSEIWVNEINTIPGSLSFYLWQPIGLNYPQLLDEMVSLALKRERERAEVSYSIETSILSGFSGGSKGSKG